jgi:paraquat-inducible protein B
MSKGASKTMIGGFVVGAVALLIVAVVIFGSGAFFSNKVKVVCFFPESVSGLNVGAPVVFRGVIIGSVVNVELWTYPKELKMKVPVYLEFDPSRFRVKEEGVTKPGANLKLQIEKGLRAQLKMQSLVTGQMMVYVDYFPNKPIRLLGAEPRYPEIPTIASGTEEIMKTLEKIPVQETAMKVTKAISGVEELINSPDLKEAIINLNGVLKDSRKVAQKLDGKLDKFDLAIQDVRKLVQSVDARVEPLSAEIQGGLADARRLIKDANGQIIPLAGNLKTTLEEAGGVLAEARMALKKASATVSEDSIIAVEIINSLDEVNRAMRSINLLAEFLKQHPEALLRGKSPGGGK